MAGLPECFIEEFLSLSVCLSCVFGGLAYMELCIHVLFYVRDIGWVFLLDDFYGVYTFFLCIRY